LSVLPAQEQRATGVVTSVSASAKLMTLETEQGEQATIALEDGTEYLRVAPGGRDVRNAERITVAAIGIGDRVLARGRPGSAGTIIASSVVVLSRRTEDREEAGRPDRAQAPVSGVIASVNAAAREFTVSVENVPVLVDAGTASFKRYAPDSPRYLDAGLSSFDQIRINDQVHATGERREGRFIAAEVVFGSFRNLAGRITNVNTATRIVTVEDMMSRQPFEVVVTEKSLVRRLTGEAAASLASRVRGAAQDPGSRGLLEELERLPGLQIGNMREGDVVLVAATQGNGPGRLTAVALLSGVEPVLAAAPLRTDPLTGHWDFNASLIAGAR
jgi:hypothetical protein